ncbi:type II fatty acid synthase component [Schizosaccharomyces japonicus yFS275]|uniref:Acyl carrier protein n=1 Tax=Schizosaccharomyces japonicus (strain yFS275 / FY16936) TaxID=402676 RepID=B6K050_SCHJY|nr:type II fatty acid synthase component [Schizosaccharomyces japonicus yFS275]EEB06200.1 type II fatty acid synthase component [Schizosaccharomyces japonicus yFS275]
MLSRCASLFRGFRAAPAVRTSLRYYSVARPDAESRILKVVSSFDKVKNAGVQVTPNSTFSKDLGLDSLDSVEVVMAIEEEFSLQIPDNDADEIKSVSDAIKYISNAKDAK